MFLSRATQAYWKIRSYSSNQNGNGSNRDANVSAVSLNTFQLGDELFGSIKFEHLITQILSKNEKERKSKKGTFLARLLNMSFQKTSLEWGVRSQ